MRDALVAALSLDVFNRNADKIVMSNIAQTVNVLQAMILTEGDKMLVTPTYHVYELYQGHQGGASVRLLCDAPAISFEDKDNKSRDLPSLAGSASIKDGLLTVSLVNTQASQAQEVWLSLRGGAIKGGALRVLAADDIHACNTFEAPEQVAPKPGQIPADGSDLHLVLPAASVTVLRARMA
jgi:alpha-N-arabinofuranosidase